MKKILIATTALVATAGVAAAEVTFGGYARAGVVYNQGNEVSETVDIRVDDTGTVLAPGDAGYDDATTVLGVPTGVSESKKTRYETRFRMNIDAKATSDAGVAFSARVRLQGDDNGDGSVGAAVLNAPRFSAEAGGLRIDAGNAAGAIDNLPGYYGFEPGLTNFVGQYTGVDYSFAGYSSGGTVNPTVYGRYASGGFAGAISYTQNASDGNPNTDDTSEAAAHLAYSFGDFTGALGYSSTSADGNNDSNMYVLSLQYGTGAFSVTGLVGSESFDNDAKDDADGGTFYGISGSYDVSPALTLGASYGDGNGDNDTQSFGIGAIYSLGGGVSVRGGIGQSKVGDGDSNTVADLGVRFNF